MRWIAVFGFVLSTLIFGLFLLPLSLLSDSRRYRASARLGRMWANATLKVFRIRVHEKPNEDDPAHKRGPRVIVANHVSYLDIAVLMSRGPCVFMAKKEVSAWPLIGFLGRLCGVVYVDRSKLWSRAHALLELQTRLQLGLDVVIFPEGSTSIEGPRKGRSNFFAGAFRIARMEAAPVEMLYIEYEDVERCAWLGDAAFAPHLCRVYSAEGTRVALRSETIQSVSSRREQNAVRGYCRNWFLEGGRNLKFLGFRPSD